MWRPHKENCWQREGPATVSHDSVGRITAGSARGSTWTPKAPSCMISCRMEFWDIWAQVSSARVLGLQGGCEHRKSERIVGEMTELLVCKGWEAYPMSYICSNTEIKPVNPKGNQPWVFIGRTNAEAEASVLWPPDVKSRLIGKDPDPGTEWRQEDKGMTEDEMAGWHHQLNGHEFKQTQKDSEGQGSLACCSPQGCKESETAEQLNNNRELYGKKSWCQLKGKFLNAFTPWPNSVLGMLLSEAPTCAEKQQVHGYLWLQEIENLGNIYW